MPKQSSLEQVPYVRVAVSVGYDGTGGLWLGYWNPVEAPLEKTSKTLGTGLVCAMLVSGDIEERWTYAYDPMVECGVGDGDAEASVKH
jgi:hypothetical protein